METSIEKSEKIDVEFIEVSAGVRYWDDATVNGVEDTKGDLIPCREGNLWKPVIRLSDGQIMDWPQGTTADIHYKICDAGLYWLKDKDGLRVAKWGGYYVPDDFLCHGSAGHGDYIIFKVGEDGKIINYRTPTVEQIKAQANDDDDDQSSWIAM